MVLRLKTRESRSLPGLLKAINVPATQDTSSRHTFGPAETQGPLKAVLSVLKTSTKVRAEHNNGILPNGKNRSGIGDDPFGLFAAVFCQGKNRWYFAKGQKPGNAGWSSPVARQAHNLKAAGSNPAPATNFTCKFSHSGNFRKSSLA